MEKQLLIRRVSGGALLLAALCCPVALRLHAARHAKTRVMGLDRVIAFTYSGAQGFDSKKLHSVTFVGPLNSGDWKYWQSRGVVAGVGHTWFDLLRSPVDKAVKLLAEQDFGGNPRPTVMIDEFGFDFGGQMDQKSAAILRQTKLKRPDLALTVFQMRGPVPQVLAETYRDVADLVMMECYVSEVRQYWFIATQVWAARKYGILPKTIIILGLGNSGNPGVSWADTKEKIEQQIRFVRLIAPESPGVGFFGGTLKLDIDADNLCSHFFHYPTNGAGLPDDVRALARTFSRRYEKPTLVVSPVLVQPNYNENGSGDLVEPKTMRAYIINLGDQDAQNVRVRLRNPDKLGGNVFAEGVVPLIAKHSEAIGVLPVIDQWRVWVGQWIIELDAPGCEVISYGP